MALTYPSNMICPQCGTGGYVWYMDKSEYVAKCTNCGHYFRKEDFPMCVLDGAPKPITNADRIRAMTDEEMAFELACSGCPKEHFIKDNEFVDCPAAHEPSKADCVKCWLDYLNQEVTTNSTT